MWHFNYYWKAFTILLWISLTSCSSGQPKTDVEKYLITAEEDAESEQWAAYLVFHLLKRTGEKTVVEFLKGSPPQKIRKGEKNIHIGVVPDLKNDYCIEHTSTRLFVRIRESKTALWIVYQLIDRISENDHRFVAADIPPAIIDFSTECRNFDFIYREPFFALNLEPEMAPVIGTNNVDNDWGIWGHNLSKIVDDRYVDEVYALVDGKRNNTQFCFSSKDLYQQLQEYIIEYHGDGRERSVCFMITPNDNELVCTCPLCKQLGNTIEDATPAVQDAIRKLAERFPGHRFFMTAYRTTSMPNKYIFPNNGGVFLSTIHLPKGVTLESQPQVKDFLYRLDAWHYKTNNIYLWDYVANFDDYLTPIPILMDLQQQLKFFKTHGIKGVFLNASGYDYSPFEDVKTYVAAALMMDVDSDVESLITRFNQKKYPQNHALINNYYISLEKRFFNMNMPYNMYGSMRDNVNSYLDLDVFIRFYEELQNAILSTAGEERDELEKLLTALTFTRLQIAFIQGAEKWGYAFKDGYKMTIKPETTILIDRLRKFKKYENLNNYKESDGSLAEYIGQWEHLLQLGDYENMLLGIPVEISSNQNYGFETTLLLTDGVPGFTQDYHQGWYLNDTDELHIRFPVGTLKAANGIRLRFLEIEKHGISPPEDIEITIDGVSMVSERLDNLQAVNENETCAVSYYLPVNIKEGETMEIIIKRGDNSQGIIALDEVQVLSRQ